MPIHMIDEIPVIKVRAMECADTTDELAAEEPLEIRLEHGPDFHREVKNISVTMRTPGNDAELAVGFLFTEGIIRSVSEVLFARHNFACNENRQNVIQVSLRSNIVPNLNTADRNFYTTSSCGVCGKSSINSIRTVNQYDGADDNNCVSATTLYDMPEQLHEQQEIFAQTGGLHASALFSSYGELLLVREDVGRHNALDKLIGAALNEDLLPLNDKVLLLSGRASFELVQKAAMAGINIIAAIGAPSTLAVQLAEEFDITLCGFLRGHRFNIYTSPHRIVLT
ncbi:formate dehydrogenase accessory sulfurtransferase FdhD [Mucilaginibacter mali]|uniref:Sulfur carrier protein FdhD n=1 Tax=Mucilaginibacter mali TaxID=2740462 RepID=A0A7D4QK17_9SPHI|nr:formate dehydrogenase accessory sulfurtransferase FdhD [Mucilaginibacter mali]QKJ30110.1 formate dehydrogenase accessory sulfurtransferase FdhD [Mucilaginibacter mali]